MDYRKVTRCRICNSKNLKKYLDLGKVPLCNNLLNTKEEEFEKYPLKVLFCEDCSLSQLSIVVNPEILYRKYVYHSSISQTFKKHCLDMARKLRKMISATKPFVIDIASNDGCLLEQFKIMGFKVMGFEPCYSLVEESRLKGIETICRFWPDNIRITEKADLITATNVFAHVDKLEPFLKCVADNLKDDGIFLIEVPYIPCLITENQFDTIYHEHLSYFTVKSLDILFKRNGFNISEVERYDIHGGSIRVYAKKIKEQKEFS